MKVSGDYVGAVINQRRGAAAFGEAIPEPLRRSRRRKRAILWILR